MNVFYTSIKHRFPGMNDIISAAKRHWAMYAKMKERETKIVVDAVLDGGRFFYCPDSKPLEACGVVDDLGRLMASPTQLAFWLARNSAPTFVMKRDLSPHEKAWISRMSPFGNSGNMDIGLYFHEGAKSRRRDWDNITAAKKFILDGLVEADILFDDSPLYIRKLVEDVRVDKEGETYVEIILIEDPNRKLVGRHYAGH